MTGFISGQGEDEFKMNTDDKILETLEKMRDEWKNRTLEKQDALDWAIKRRRYDLINDVGNLK